jgi:hypothetical protein
VLLSPFELLEHAIEILKQPPYIYIFFKQTAFIICIISLFYIAVGDSTPTVQYSTVCAQTCPIPPCAQQITANEVNIDLLRLYLAPNMRPPAPCAHHTIDLFPCAQHAPLSCAQQISILACDGRT